MRYKWLLALVLVLPLVTLAQVTGPGGVSGPWSPDVAAANDTSTFAGMVNYVIINIGGPIRNLIVAGALIYFLWGLFQYINSGGDPATRKKATGTMTWGIIVLAVMVSVWGLVNLLLDTFPLDTKTPKPPPFILSN